MWGRTGKETNQQRPPGCTGSDCLGESRAQSVNGSQSARGKCFTENGGVAGDTAYTIVFHQSLEFTARDQIAANVIQPDGSPKVLELF